MSSIPSIMASTLHAIHSALARIDIRLARLYLNPVNMGK
jgi:hypothetical protein